MKQKLNVLILEISKIYIKVLQKSLLCLLCSYSYDLYSFSYNCALVFTKIPSSVNRTSLQQRHLFKT